MSIHDDLESQNQDSKTAVPTYIWQDLDPIKVFWIL